MAIRNGTFVISFVVVTLRRIRNKSVNRVETVESAAHRGE